MRTMQADELFGIEPFLEPGDGLVQQIADAADVQPHIVAFGLDPVDLGGDDAAQFGFIGDPEFFRPGRILAFAAARFRGAFAHPGNGQTQALVVDRFQHIVDRGHVKGLDRKPVEGGDEDDCRGIGPAGKRPGDIQAVLSGHGDIEQQQVGFQLFGQPQSRLAVAGGADQVDVRLPRTEQLQAFDCQWFIIDNQCGQRFAFDFFRHGLSSINGKVSCAI